MRKLLGAILALFTLVSIAHADSVLIIDAGYSTVTANVKGRIEAAGHTTTVTSDVSLIPTNKNTYQQVWDLRYSAALTAGEQTNYQAFVTAGGFAYFVTENPGCCMARNNSVAALVTALGGGTTTIGANYNTAADVESNVNTKYMTSGITVNYAAVSAIINSQGIPLIQDGTGDVSGMSWIGRAGNLGQGVTGTIVTVADTNWLDNVRFSTAQGATVAQQQNVTALDDIIRGIVAGTVGGTISANGNGAAASNGGGNQAPPPPTVVSTAAGPNAITSTTTYGNATTTNVVVDGKNVNGKNLTVTRTITPVTTTPFTNTITTVPSTVTTYSDGSTTSTNGTPVVSSTTGTVTNIGTASSQSASVSAVGLKDSIAYRNFNTLIVDPLSLKNGAWASTPFGYAKMSGGNVQSTGAVMGYNKIVDNNAFGFAVQYQNADNHNYLNGKGDQTAYAGTAYILSKQNYFWVKTSVGMSSTEYASSVSIPSFNLNNSNKVKQNNVYGDLTLYSPKDFKGFRPLFGVTVQNSNITSVQEYGSPLLSTAPPKGSTNEARPYAGVRYDFNDSIGVESRVLYSKDFNTVSQNKISVKKNITDNAYIELGTGFDKGSNYTAGTFSAGLRVNF